MATFPYPDCKFELSHRLALESNDDKAAVIFDTESRTRMKVSRALYALMLEFKSPCRLDEVLDQKQLQSLQPLLERLLDAGFLVDIKKQRLPLPKPEVRLAPVFPTMFQAPLHETGQPPSDVAIVGVPYDGGNIVDPGMRHAPHEMRRRSCSQEYRLDCLTGKPKGWFDAGNNERILEGVTISDWGDLRFTYGEAPEVIYKRLGAVCAEIVRQGSFPAFIGGDHSISYPIVEALQSQQEIQVVWFDAHTDYGELLPGICHNHKNVVRRIFQLPNVAMVTNIGHRGFTVSDKVNHRPEKFSMVTAAEIRNQGEYLFQKTLHPDLPCYISMDINVLDPVYAPGSSTPSPGGLTPEEMRMVLRVIADNHRIVGCDLCEVNPRLDPGFLTLIHAYRMLTVCLAASVSGNAAKHPEARAVLEQTSSR